MIETGDARKSLDRLIQLFNEMGDLDRAKDTYDSLDNEHLKLPKFDEDYEDRRIELRHQMSQMVDTNHEMAGAMLAAELERLPNHRMVLYCLIRTSWNMLQYNKDDFKKFERGFNTNYN